MGKDIHCRNVIVAHNLLAARPVADHRWFRLNNPFDDDQRNGRPSFPHGHPVNPDITLHWEAGNTLGLLDGQRTFANGTNINAQTTTWPLDFTVTPLLPAVTFKIYVKGQADNVTGEKAVDNIRGRVVNVDLDVDANYDNKIDVKDEPLEENPGGIGCVCTNNLTPINLKLEPAALPGKLTLSATMAAGGGGIRVWENGAPITLPQTWAANAYPSTLSVEGTNASTTARDVELRLEYNENPVGLDNPLFKCADTIRLTILKVDLDFVVNLTTWPEVGGRGSAAADNVYVLVQPTPMVTIDDLLSMGFPLRIHSSVTLPAGYLDSYVAAADAALTMAGGDIRVLYKAPTLETLGVLPTPESDSIQEFTSCDNATAGGGSDHTDSAAFDTQMLANGFVQRGKARDNGNYATLEAKANHDFMVHGGVQYVWFTMCGSETEKRQIRDQADWLYWSGHGSHSSGGLATLDASLAATDVQWGNDLEVVILAGCSVLDIKDYRAQSFGMLTWAEWVLAGGDWSPGAQWEGTGPQYLLGYCWKAPLDSAGTAGIINSFFTAYNGGASIPAAWGTANNLAIGRNACVIDTSVTPHEYWYWDETSGTPVWTKKIKGATGW